MNNKNIIYFEYKSELKLVKTFQHLLHKGRLLTHDADGNILGAEGLLKLLETLAEQPDYFYGYDDEGNEVDGIVEMRREIVDVLEGFEDGETDSRIGRGYKGYEAELLFKGEKDE